jgi:hypothetical protein
MTSRTLLTAVRVPLLLLVVVIGAGCSVGEVGQTIGDLGRGMRDAQMNRPQCVTGQQSSYRVSDCPAR